MAKVINNIAVMNDFLETCDEYLNYDGIEEANRIYGVEITYDLIEEYSKKTGKIKVDDTVRAFVEASGYSYEYLLGYNPVESFFNYTEVLELQKHHNEYKKMIQYLDNTVQANYKRSKKSVPKTEKGREDLEDRMKVTKLFSECFSRYQYYDGVASLIKKLKIK